MIQANGYFTYHQYLNLYVYVCNWNGLRYRLRANTCRGRQPSFLQRGLCLEDPASDIA